MLLIREVFFCKPGQVRPMVEKFKAMNKLTEKLGLGKSRIMTDLSAERYWTVVAEWEVKSLRDFEEMMKRSATQGKEFEHVMKGYHNLVESGRREIYTIEVVGECQRRPGGEHADIARRKTRKSAEHRDRAGLPLHFAAGRHT